MEQTSKKYLMNKNGAQQCVDDATVCVCVHPFHPYILYKLAYLLIISGGATGKLLEGLPMERRTGDWESAVGRRLFTVCL